MSEVSCKIILLTEREKMIATALKIQQATGDAVTDFSTMMLARDIFKNHNTMTNDELSEALFKYSAHLSALTASLVTSACLTESQLNDMVSDIKEFENLGKEMN